MKMHWYIIFLYMPFLCSGAVNSLKPLTESLGQEVIEMDAPIKELPPEMEEEPSAENDEVKSVATTLPSSITISTTKETRRKMKETEQTRSNQEDDEARIEKELSELYKDSADYKADSAEVSRRSETNASTTNPTTTEEDIKPVARARQEFKFQPDTNNRADVERFRTSVDVISCNKNRLTGATSKPLSSGNRMTSSAAIVAAIFIKAIL